eukprot:TRINITY_DN2061_c0_g1_i1.p2 TRINITY_DN2061_c0_g1~~TRINITY_DN2061_c0_g1_i1.p2  ORF type:complete len:191 (+),score=18.41 TRINITY_DN2061_c0_g1_i1:104-676(+)
MMMARQIVTTVLLACLVEGKECEEVAVNGTEWMPDEWVPRCEGPTWDEVQCSIDGTWCWCVKPDGDVVEGSQVKDPEVGFSCGGDRAEHGGGVLLWVTIGAMVFVTLGVTLFCLIHRSRARARHINQILVDDESLDTFSPSYANDSFAAPPTLEATPQQPLCSKPPTPPIPRPLSSPLVPLTATASAIQL